MLSRYTLLLDTFLTNPKWMRRVQFWYAVIMGGAGAFFGGIAYGGIGFVLGLVLGAIFSQFCLLITYFFGGAIWFVVGGILGGEGKFKDCGLASIFNGVYLFILTLPIALISQLAFSDSVDQIEFGDVMGLILSLVVLLIQLIFTAQGIAFVHRIGIWKVAALLVALFLGLVGAFAFIGLWASLMATLSV